MVERLCTTYRPDSTEVQGEDSWVELSYITRDEADASFKSEAALDKVLKEHVIAWNWKDSEGKPFGDPKDNLRKLFIPERHFLIEKLFHPDEEKRKNS